ncbi:MAG: hypothetical protein WBW03_06490 [Silvibacterium sp.]
MAIRLVRSVTGVGQESLCRSCRYASIQAGYSVTEEEIRCSYLREVRLISFPVKACTDYLSKETPTVYELEKIAFIIDLNKFVESKIEGFGSAVLAGKSDTDE